MLCFLYCVNCQSTVIGKHIHLTKTITGVLRGGDLGDAAPPLGVIRIFCFIYCLNNAKFGQFILSYIVKTVDTRSSRCQILRQNAPNTISAEVTHQTTPGKLTALPVPLAGFEGYTNMGTEEQRDGRGGEVRKGDSSPPFLRLNMPMYAGQRKSLDTFQKEG